MVIFGDLTWWHLILWHTVIFGDFWWHLMIFRDKTTSSVMICHDISWSVMISHQPIQRGRSVGGFLSVFFQPLCIQMGNNFDSEQTINFRWPYGIIILQFDKFNTCKIWENTKKSLFITSRGKTYPNHIHILLLLRIIFILCACNDL